MSAPPPHQVPVSQPNPLPLAPTTSTLLRPRVRTKHLTQEQRQRVRTLRFDGGLTISQVERVTGYTHAQIVRATRADSAAPKPRSGRPKKTPEQRAADQAARKAAREAERLGLPPPVPAAPTAPARQPATPAPVYHPQRPAFSARNAPSMTPDLSALQSPVPDDRSNLDVVAAQAQTMVATNSAGGAAHNPIDIDDDGDSDAESERSTHEDTGADIPTPSVFAETPAAHSTEARASATPAPMHMQAASPATPMPAAAAAAPPATIPSYISGGGPAPTPPNPSAMAPVRVVPPPIGGSSTGRKVYLVWCSGSTRQGRSEQTVPPNLLAVYSTRRIARSHGLRTVESMTVRDGDYGLITPSWWVEERDLLEEGDPKLSLFF